MTILLPKLLNALRGASIYEFRKTYPVVTAAFAVGVAWVMRRSATPKRETEGAAAIAPFRRDFLSKGSLAAMALVIVILAGYATVAIKWEHFADYDESTFTLFTVRGHNFEPPIWPASGRFFPLGQQEFNVIRHFTSSAAGYHAAPIAELAIVCCILFFLDDALTFSARATLAAAFLVLPSIVTSFSGLVFPDRNVVFWIACLLLFVKLFERTRSTLWAVAAAICGLNMLFYKETAFLLLFGFAAGRLILRCRRPGRDGWDLACLRDRDSRLDLCFLFSVLLFLFYYAAVMFPHPNMQYARQYSVPLDKTLVYYLTLDLFAVVFAAVALRRAYQVFRRRVSPTPFWDALALGGIAYCAAFLYLRLCRPYYMAPVDFIAVLYVGRFVFLSWQKMRWTSRTAILAVALVILLQSVSLSSFRLYERENIVQAEDRLADAIVIQSQNDPSHAQRLYFPFSLATPITEFSSYLTYRGVAVEGYPALGRPVSSKSAVIVDKAFSVDGPCVNYRDFVCHAGPRPNPGDLVIELPMDPESQAYISPYQSGGLSLFTYQPRPRLPQWMIPLLTYLRVASIRWQPLPLPDRWLHASVTQWK